MRRLSALLLLAAASALPAHAWEMRAGALCEMVHEGAEADLRVTYDPATPEYAISIRRRAGPWPDGPSFAIRFSGAGGLTITTNRHTLSEGGVALTVTDRGFGNVLLGLESGGSATALTGDAAVPFSLDGAAEAVAAFRACTSAPSV